MTASSGHLTKLVQLAREKSSAKRRDLLRDITDLFFDEAEARQGAAADHAGDIMATVASEMEESVRVELAERFADAANAPAGLVRQLALDAFAVARPILERSVALDEATLVEAARTRGQAHVRAIAGRAEVTAAVAEAVAEHGDEDALVTLAANEGAEMSRATMETLVDRAERCEKLHEPLVARKEMPADLLQEMFFVVKNELRDRILERNEALDPAELEAAFAAAERRLLKKATPFPPDYDDAKRFIKMKRLRKKLDIDLLIHLLEAGERTRFLVGFAELAELDFSAARRVADNPAVDALAIACRAADLPRDGFVRMAIMRQTESARAPQDAEVLAALYDSLPQDTAERAMRFWRVRKDAEAA